MDQLNFVEESVLGNFCLDGKKIASNLEGKLSLNRYNINKAKLIFDEIVPHNYDNNEDLVFETKKLKLNLAFNSLRNSRITFRISAIETNLENQSEKYIYTSGPIKDILYFENEIKLPDFIINKKWLPNKHFEKSSWYSYSITSDSKLSRELIDKLFLLLSTYTSSKFFLREIHQPDGTLILENRNSSNRSIPLRGSGRMIFPLDFEKLFEALNMVEPILFKKIHLKYSTFCTYDGMLSEQLIKGCNLLDYLIEISDLGKGHKSKLTFKLLKKLYDSDNSIFKYLDELLDNYPQNIHEISKKEFDFWELRNKYVHRGEILYSRKQMLELQKAIFSLNEILRMIIARLPSFKTKEIDDVREIIHSNDIQDSISKRREIFGKEW